MRSSSALTGFLGTIALYALQLGVTSASPVRAIKSRQSTDKLVFAHFMIGIVSDRTSSADYDADMQRAKDLGIDAFALNIGTDSYTDTQLAFAYQSAVDNDMNVFISFDFNWWSTSEAAEVGAKIAQYATYDSQLYVDDKAFASSFAGDGLDVSTLKSSAGIDVFFAPNFHPSYGTDLSTIDGALNWMAWDNNGNNKAPTAGANVTVEDGDAEYISALDGKPYIAPVSAWFSTHYGPEVSYSKNWVFPGDLLWFRRWSEVLDFDSSTTPYLEIITWNDYGESHYIGPLDSPHYDDGNSKWTNDMPHDGWLDMAKPFISAFHAGATSVDDYITEDQIIYWYRPTLSSLDCDATDTTMVAADNSSGNYFEGRPNGWQDLADSVFVVTLLTEPGTLTINSGSNSQSFDAPAGASSFSLAMDVGVQSYTLERDGEFALEGTSLKDISSICICGIYNFNAYVGTIPPGDSDPLQPDGLNSLTAGLHVSTCSATPSLGTIPITTVSGASPTDSGSSTSASSTAVTTTATSSSETTSASTPTSMTSSLPSSTATSSAVSTTMVSSLTTSAVSSTGSVTACNRIITASSQLYPTNCLQKGDVWEGPSTDTPPSPCDGPVVCSYTLT